MLHSDSSESIVTSGSRVFRAPPHHTLQGGLPALLNLHGSILGTKSNSFKFKFF